MEKYLSILETYPGAKSMVEFKGLSLLITAIIIIIIIIINSFNVDIKFTIKIIWKEKTLAFTKIRLIYVN